jgi:hypothetical protein
VKAAAASEGAATPAEASPHPAASTSEQEHIQDVERRVREAVRARAAVLHSHRQRHQKAGAAKTDGGVVAGVVDLKKAFHVSMLRAV